MLYSNRVVVYADILGWSSETNSIENQKPIQAVKKIHERAQLFNAKTRAEERDELARLLALPGFTPVGPTNPEAREIQFGAFSDNVVFSCDPFMIRSTIDIVAGLVIELLHQGFLVRGAVGLGPLHHMDNIIVGPALNAVVKAEQKEAMFPRLLVSDDVASLYVRGSEPPLKGSSIILDQLGRHVVNPFCLRFEETGAEQPLLENFEATYFGLQSIRTEIESKIQVLQSSGDQHNAEKWQYMFNFIDGPVLSAAPALGRFWNSVSIALK